MHRQLRKVADKKWRLPDVAKKWSIKITLTLMFEIKIWLKALVKPAVQPFILCAVTSDNPVPVLCRTGAVVALPTDGDPVALPTLQRADVAGGAVGGAFLVVCDVEGFGRGVVVQDAAAGRPGHHSCVGVAVQGRTQTTVGTRAWRERGGAVTQSEKTQQIRLNRGTTGASSMHLLLLNGFMRSSLPPCSSPGVLFVAT